MRTLESRILRKASVRFGEGRTEKCPQWQLAGRLLDFVILCRGTAQEARGRMEPMMQKLKLRVNPQKTRVCRVPEESFDFLGYTLSPLPSG